MIRSMTGFGEAVRELPQGQLRATVKTVNHRFFNAHLRTPHGFDRFEAELQTLLKGFFSRGHINLGAGWLSNANPGNDDVFVLSTDGAGNHQWGKLFGGKNIVKLGLSIVKLIFVHWIEDVFQAIVSNQGALGMETSNAMKLQV